MIDSPDIFSLPEIRKFVMSNAQKKVIITVKVVPASGRLEFKLDTTGNLKCYLKSAAERGLANHELITFLAKTLKLAKNSVTLIRGHTTRIKHISIVSSLNKNEIYAALGCTENNQMSLYE